MSTSRQIPLSDGTCAIVDARDFEWAAQWSWYANSAGYAARTQHNPKRNIRMHRALAERWGWAIDGLEIDHISHDTRDNRRVNLRVSDRTGNVRNIRRPKHNTSGIKGVSWHSQRCKWRAVIQVAGKQIALGLYDTKLEAAAAYARASREHHGDFGCTG